MTNTHTEVREMMVIKLGVKYESLSINGGFLKRASDYMPDLYAIADFITKEIDKAYNKGYKDGFGKDCENGAREYVNKKEIEYHNREKINEIIDYLGEDGLRRKMGGGWEEPPTDKHDDKVDKDGISFEDRLVEPILVYINSLMDDSDLEVDIVDEQMKLINTNFISRDEVRGAVEGLETFAVLPGIGQDWVKRQDLKQRLEIE